MVYGHVGTLGSTMRRGSIQAWRHGEALLEHGCLLSGEPSSVPRHVHDEFQISVELTGPVQYQIEGRSQRVEAGELIVISPGVAHEMSDPGPRSPVGEYRVAYVPVEMVRALTAGAGCALRDASVITQAEIVSRFSTYHQASQHGLLRRELDALLASFLTVVRPLLDASPSLLPIRRRFTCELYARLDSAKDFLLRDLTSNPSVMELSEHAKLGVSEMNREFSRRFGIPPHRFLLGARIDRAKRMLLRGDAINAVAFATGFVDQAHFTRHFKRIVQITPGNYIALRERTYKTRT